MTEEMFQALIYIIDAKIATHAARDTWDAGLHETINERELIDEFREKFVTKETEG